MYDLKISGGTVIDGTGTDRFVGDVAVTDGVIVHVGPSTPGDAARTIDATGLVVTPGFVDCHTHYDGQVTWDDELNPSAGHGVTTVVMGNCGVGFAPVHPGSEEWLIQLMEGVEDIPGAALSEGITWGWETFPEYLDVLDQRRLGIDVGTQVPHGAVRAYVMGERGARNEPATPEDIEAMRRIVEEAIEAGALGVSTSRVLGHRAMDGEQVPGTFAAEDELFGIGRALQRQGRGVFELAPAGADGQDLVRARREVDWMRRLSAEVGAPVTFAMLQVDAEPNLWREIMAESLAAIDEGAQLHPQVAARPFGLLVGFQTHHPFGLRPSYRELADLTIDERIEFLRRPAVRSRILAEDDVEPDGKLFSGMPALLRMALQLLHPTSVSGLSDGGAHCGMICDASIPTYLLTHWTRDRKRGARLPLEWVVRKQTRDTAHLFGLTDRGELAVGKKADVNVIDLENLTLHSPRLVHDLPAGGRRLLQDAVGYRHTIVSGHETRRDGVDTGARPGRLIRGA